jgi:hypothetical protein
MPITVQVHFFNGLTFSFALKHGPNGSKTRYRMDVAACYRAFAVLSHAHWFHMGFVYIVAHLVIDDLG